MHAERTRRTVVRATVPLIGQFDTLTMARIAQAAGIDEADLRAVFADEEAVLRACVSLMTERIGAAMDPAAEVRRLEAVRADQPVAARLAEVIEVLAAYHARVRADLENFEQATLPGREADDRSLSRGDLRDLGGLPEFRQAVARLLEPEGHRLRLPADALAEIFLGMARTCTRAPNEVQPLPADQVVALFLHGALTTG